MPALEKDKYFQFTEVTEYSNTNNTDSSSTSVTTNDINTPRWYCRISNWLRIFIICILCALIIVAIVYHQITVHLFTSFLQWMKENIVEGSAAFMLIYTCCTVSMIPGSILTLGAGFVYVDLLGPFNGVCASAVIVWISASIGATLSFINGRYLLRDCIVSWASKYDKFEIIERIVKEYGFSVTFWLRLSSITPYNVFNYFMGLTSVTLRDYTLAHTGMIPDITVYCFIGGSISELVEIAETGVGDNLIFIIVLTSTLVISIAGMITISCFAKKKFDQMVQEIKEQDNKVNKLKEHDSFDALEDRIVEHMNHMRTHSKLYESITV